MVVPHVVVLDSVEELFVPLDDLEPLVGDGLGEEKEKKHVSMWRVYVSNWRFGCCIY